MFIWIPSCRGKQVHAFSDLAFRFFFPYSNARRPLRGTYGRKGTKCFSPPSRPGVNGPRLMSSRINNAGPFERNHMHAARAVSPRPNISASCMKARAPFCPGWNLKQKLSSEGTCFGSPVSRGNNVTKSHPHRRRPHHPPAGPFYNLRETACSTCREDFLSFFFFFLFFFTPRNRGR